MLLPAIVFAVAFAYCYIRFMGLEDPSQSDIGPDFMMAMIPSIPLLLSAILWIGNIFVVIFGPLALVILLGSMNAVSECAIEVKDDLTMNEE